VASTYEPIASQTLGSAAASMTFSGIAASWTDLVLVAIGNNAAAGSLSNTLNIRLNSDTGSNYSVTAISGTGSSAVSGRDSNATEASIGGVGQASSSPGIGMAHIMSYANTNVYKTILGSYVVPSELLSKRVNLWRSTSAVTAITLFSSGGHNLAAGFTASLYGIKAA